MWSRPITTSNSFVILHLYIYIHITPVLLLEDISYSQKQIQLYSTKKFNAQPEIHNNEVAILAYTSLKSARILFADSTLPGNNYIGWFD
jgi:hypothetical protein